ncbi:MAG: hypothetical protein ACREGK_06205, partial [Geminicoccales bacterium]
MSFILDALRKSEIERQRQNGPTMAEFPIAREDRRLPVALIAIGFLLAVNLAVVLFFLLRDSRTPVAEAQQVATAPATGQALQAAQSSSPGAPLPQADSPPMTAEAPPEYY